MFLDEVKSNPGLLNQINFGKPREIASIISGISVSSLDRIRSQFKTECLVPPREGYIKKTNVTDIDDFNKSVLKRTVASFYEEGQYPTVCKILERFKKQVPEFKCGETSMKIILKNLGYKYKTNADGRKYLMERTDIVCARMSFLRKMKELRDSNDDRPRFYLDETWINQNHTRKRMWLGENDEGGFQNQRLGKGQRLIICHAGSAKTGFLKEAKMVFKAIKSNDSDYHTEMNGDRYLSWFSDFLNILEEPSIIIIDNASYR
jgi:hypothetical protein